MQLILYPFHSLYPSLHPFKTLFRYFQLNNHTVFTSVFVPFRIFPSEPLNIKAVKIFVLIIQSNSCMSEPSPVNVIKHIRHSVTIPCQQNRNDFFLFFHTNLIYFPAYSLLYLTTHITPITVVTVSRTAIILFIHIIPLIYFK